MDISNLSNKHFSLLLPWNCNMEIWKYFLGSNHNLFSDVLLYWNIMLLFSIKLSLGVSNLLPPRFCFAYLSMSECSPFTAFFYRLELDGECMSTHSASPPLRPPPLYYLAAAFASAWWKYRLCLLWNAIQMIEFCDFEKCE